MWPFELRRCACAVFAALSSPGQPSENIVFIIILGLGFNFWWNHFDKIDARLVVTMARTAASLGAAVVTSARAVRFLREAREVIGVRVRDMEAAPGSPDAEFDVRARTVIAAAGVWTDDMSRMLGDVGVRPGFRVRASKGVHLVVPR